MDGKHIYLYALLFAFLLISIPEVYGMDDTSTACMTCHTAANAENASNRFRHSIVSIGCTTCHTARKDHFDDAATTISTQNIMKDAIISLGELPPDNRKNYEIKIETISAAGIKNDLLVFDTGDQVVLNLPESSFNIRSIFDIEVEKIKKGLFSTAVISWTTNVPASSTINYSTDGERAETAGFPENVFSRRHRAVLQGMRNNSRYVFSITCRDLNGNTIRSEEFTFDTSGELDRAEEREGITAGEPGIREPMLFRIGGKDEIFLRASAGRAARFRISFAAAEKDRSRACRDNGPSERSTIEACINCHPQGASHPVGVRSSDPGLTVPDELPTINDGIITCVTCHEPHGGQRRYFLRMEFSKEICVKCHPDYYGS